MIMSNNCNETPCTECNDCLDLPPVPCATPIYTYDDPVLTSDDIKYLGDTDSCIPVTKFDIITNIFKKIILFAKNRLYSITSTSLKVTATTNLCNKVQNIELVPSTDPNNALRLGNDGLPYVFNTGGSINIANGTCISFTKTVVNNVIVFTPVIDMNCLSSYICTICAGQVCAIPNQLSIT